MNQHSNVGTNKSLGFLVGAAIAAAVLSASSGASAQVDYEVTYPSEDGNAAPKKVRANKGFQMALGTGYAVPFGDVDNSLALSDFSSGQVPILLDIGYKKSPHFYIGGYAGYGIGQAGDMFKDVCVLNGVSCSFSTLRIGINLQYHIKPSEKINPYVGYGLGYESATFSVTGPGGTGELTASGFELARIAVGVDYRANATIGFGPFLDYGIGCFLTASEGRTSYSIAGTTLHSWLTLGVRMTLFP